MVLLIEKRNLYEVASIWYSGFVNVVALRGVVEDLSALRDRGPGFKTGTRPLTLTKAVTEFSEPYTLWGSHCANEFC